MDLYREEILEHWQNPQNFGKMRDADVVVEQTNPLCGDEVTFYFKLSAGPASSFPPVSARSLGKSKRDGKSSVALRAAGNPSTAVTRELLIKDVSFEGEGCAISIAAASILSGVLKGKKAEKIEKMTGEDILGLLGAKRQGFPPARLRCVLLPLEAVRRIFQ